ncbi:MAG: DUF4390 domain-containing protein [Deltaproteobacteria bacterium]|jgi:hypothetical protein|nr:DUF4390 domain-containing protein [Deltaproteobacteria bacterium]
MHVRKSHAAGDDYPYITSLAVEKNAKYLVVSCSVKNGLTSEIMNALKSGITVIFNYDLELTIPGFIKDQTILSTTIRKAIKLDSIKNEYRIMLTQNNTRIITTTNINDANDILFNINQYELAPIKLLEKDKVYKIRTRLYTDKIVTDLPLNTILNTFSNFGYKTKWYEVNFQY